MATKEIEPNTVYWDWADYEHVHQDGDEIQREMRNRKQIKFLLLPNAISNPTWLKAHLAAEDSYMNKGSRAADGQKYGRKLTLGWIKLRYPGYDNMRTAPTLQQPELLAAFYPLIREMDQLVERAVPDYHKYAFECAMKATRPDVRDPESGRPMDEDDLSRVTKERGLNIVKALDPWNLTYTIRGTRLRLSALASFS